MNLFKSSNITEKTALDLSQNLTYHFILFQMDINFKVIYLCIKILSHKRQMQVNIKRKLAKMKNEMLKIYKVEKLYSCHFGENPVIYVLAPGKLWNFRVI